MVKRCSCYGSTKEFTTTDTNLNTSPEKSMLRNGNIKKSESNREYIQINAKKEQSQIHDKSNEIDCRCNNKDKQSLLPENMQQNNNTETIHSLKTLPIIKPNERNNSNYSNDRKLAVMTTNTAIHSDNDGSEKLSQNPPAFETNNKNQTFTQQSLFKEFPLQNSNQHDLNVSMSININDEDPYCALEEYLERVKNEINEVFELHQKNLKCNKNQSNDGDISSSDFDISTDETDKSEQILHLESLTNEQTCQNNQKWYSNITKNEFPREEGDEEEAEGDEHSLKKETASAINNKLNEQKNPSSTFGQLKNIENLSSTLLNSQNELITSMNKSAINIYNQNFNIFGNKFFHDLDDRTSFDKSTSSNIYPSITLKTSQLLIPETKSLVESNRLDNKTLLRPEKHVTIPLQAFNLDCALNITDKSRKSIIAGFKTTLHQQYCPLNLTSRSNEDNLQIMDTENVTYKCNCNTIQGYKDNNTNNNLGNLKIAEDFNKHTKVNKLAINETTKKGSTSTICTSEESILKSVGHIDGDNVSITSSSICDEAGNLSTAKNTEILTVNDNLTNSLTSIQNVCPDDADLLDVLSLCDDSCIDEETIEYNNFEIETEQKENNSDDTIQTSDSVDSGETFDNQSNSRRFTLAEPNELTRGVFKRKYNNRPILCGNERHQRCQSLMTCINKQERPNHFHQLQHQHSMPNHLYQFSNHTKDRTPLSLKQELSQQSLNMNRLNDLPSPGVMSHCGVATDTLTIRELATKSSSAPLLLKRELRHHDFINQNVNLRYSRSQSDRYLAEIEAVEACKWLRAAGFPQYAQMYEDHQFPVDLSNVAKDHTNLENDQLQSLYRRLCILNRCSNLRLDHSHKSHNPQKEDSDDENFALSENWSYQPHIRRWSRVGEMEFELPPAATLLNVEKVESSSKESSPDRFEDDVYDNSRLLSSLPHDPENLQHDDSTDSSDVRLRRTGSERLKDGAKALLRRVESIKSRRRKRQNRAGIVLSGPNTLDFSEFGQNNNSLRKPDVYSTPPSPAVSPIHSYPKVPFLGSELKVPHQSEQFLSPNRLSPRKTPTPSRSMRTSPLHFFSSPMPHLKEDKIDDSVVYYSDSQDSTTSTGKSTSRKFPLKPRRFLQRTGKVDDVGAHSDSECHQGRKLFIKDANFSTSETKIKKLTRGGSLNLGKDGKHKEGFRSASFRSRSTTRKENKSDDKDNLKTATVVRWHSFQTEERPPTIFRKCFTNKTEKEANENGTLFASMSAGQLQIIRKLALVILTGHMERYCPTHRSGWNWELPKFIKKIKTPDYREKKVFGVPLLLILQRSGQTLPAAIRAALRWLQMNALDQVGIFRKSGVKSRILKLKELIECTESSEEYMDIFDAQQSYDVADMFKQYFRDLPEPLLTTKMSETFIAVFQHLPFSVRLDAVQSAVLLLPDENREILYTLLEFLTIVADNSQSNQMTSNNLAVCLAPSIFHNSISTGLSSVSASPRRRKGCGVPDAKELNETKASHECLAFMIDNYKQIYTATKEKISRCNFGYMEESKPVTLECLGEGMQFHNWRGYLYECTSATIKEGREKSRSWITIPSQTDNNIEISYKKIGDGHPLRLWRCVSEVEGPPRDVLDFIIRQRATWDSNLLESQTVKKLDDRTEIFKYAIDGQVIVDFCILRSWQTDLPRGACVIVETSIDYPKAKPCYGTVRGVVLASRYLVEPCGSGKSRVMHLARVDIKGKTPEWYNKSYGHICSHYLSKIRLAFKHFAEGPESKI